MAAYFSMVVINGIITFQLTPGTRLETGKLWELAEPVRALYLEPVRSRFELASAPQWGNLVLFVVLLVAGLGVVGYMVREVRRNPARGTKAALRRSMSSRPARPPQAPAATVRALLAALALGSLLAPPRLSIAGDGETSAVAGKHPPLTVRQGRLWAATGAEGEPIAEVSAHCLSCHDERAAAEERPAAHPRDSTTGEHPVDIAYPEAEPGYARRERLDPALLLLEGRVTCVTCHAHDDPEHGLVLTGENSELCRACHLT